MITGLTNIFGFAGLCLSVSSCSVGRSFPGGPCFHKDPQSPEKDNYVGPARGTGGGTPGRLNRYGGTGGAPGKRTLTQGLPVRSAPLGSPALAAAAEPDAYEDGGAMVYAEPCEPGPMVEVGPLALQPPPLLSPEKKRDMITDTEGRINRAYTNFLIACERNRALIKVAVEAKGFLSVLFEIALGVLMPSLSKILKGIGEAIEEAVAPAMVEALKKLAAQENVSALVTEVTGKAKEALKTKAEAALAGGRAADKTELDVFLTFLEDQAGVEYQTLAEGVKKQHELVLVSLYYAFDANLLKQSDYVESIKARVDEYKETVQKIGAPEEKSRGKEPFDTSWTEHDMAYWVIDDVNDPPKPRRMMLAHHKHEPEPSYPGRRPGPGSNTYSWKRWIETEDFHVVAERKVRAITGGPIEEIRASEVWEIPHD